MTLTSSVRPNRSGRPRRSISAGRPATPIATPAVPWRQGRPKLSLITTARSIPVAAASPRRSVSALRSGFSGNRSTRWRAIRGPHVRLVHPGVRHDEAEPVLDDQHAAASPHDANRLRQDDLHKPRVLVDLRRKRDSLWRRVRSSRGRRCDPRPSRRSSARRRARLRPAA